MATQNFSNAELSKMAENPNDRASRIYRTIPYYLISVGEEKKRREKNGKSKNN